MFAVLGIIFLPRTNNLVTKDLLSKVYKSKKKDLHFLKIIHLMVKRNYSRGSSEENVINKICLGQFQMTNSGILNAS